MRSSGCVARDAFCRMWAGNPLRPDPPVTNWNRPFATRSPRNLFLPETSAVPAETVCTVRLLRKHGVHARLVIGYRPSPFFSHAWVEVDGRVVYGSPAYQKRLQPLFVA